MSKKTFRFFILTGPPGVGKTTLIKQVCKLLENKNYGLNGFFTEEVRVGKERIGFDVILLNGNRGILARTSEEVNDPRVGKYYVKVKSFESLIKPVLDNSFQDHSSVLILDEIGKMELLSLKFQEAVFKIIEQKENVILATVPLKTAKTIPLIEKIKTHPDACLINVTRDNRNSLVDEVVRLIVKSQETLKAGNV